MKLSRLESYPIRPGVLAALVALAAVLAPGCAPPGASGPDLILTGGIIYPSGTTDTTSQALAIQDDRILALGSDAEIFALVGDATQQMRLDGSVVLPGLYDAWIDLEALGRWPGGLDLRRATTPREIQSRLRATLGSGGEGWILGWGWDETRWPRPELPSYRLLDEVESERPVLLVHRSDQLGWLNSAAMDRSNLRSSSPAQGVLLAPDGSWNGLVTDDALRGMLQSLEPEPQVRKGWIANGLRTAVAAGLTRVTTSPIDATAVMLLQQLAADGDLPIRVEMRVRPDAVDDLERLSFDPEWLTLAAVGLDLDGPFGPRLAALDQGYSDAAGLGWRSLDPETVSRACLQAERWGLRFDVQAHGDLAIGAALRCALLTEGSGMLVGADLLPADFAESLRGARVAAVPMRLEHDLAFIESRIGPERAPRSHAYRSLLARGSLAAFASMAPRYPLAPMASLFVAWKRQDLRGYPIDAWVAPERLSLDDLMRLALGLGSGAVGLSEGAAADLVIWSQDPFVASEDSLLQTRAMVTFVAGRVVYSRPLAQASPSGG